MPAPLVSATEAADRLKKGDAILLDVREPFELNLANVPKALHIPMMQVPARLDAIPKDRTILVMCHHGGRSQQVADWLLAQGYPDVANVAGGIDAWTDEVDGTVPKY